MLKLIPRDVWVAAALVIVVCLLEFFDPEPAIFVAVYLALCAYIVVQTFSSENK
jgi:MFS superfamily sulfate permease-like transporter